MAAFAGPGTIPLIAVRDTVADVLAPIDADDPPVLVEVPDAIYPPVLLILPADPYIELGVGAGAPTMGPRLLTAHLRIRCVAGRTDVGSGIRTIDELIVHVIGRMRDTAYTWELQGTTGARNYDMAGATYLGADVNYTAPVHP